MARQTGSLIQYAISPESTAGTYVAPVSSEYFPKGDGTDFGDKKEMATNTAKKGTISTILERRISKLWGEGTIVSPMGYRMMGIVLQAAFGQIGTTTGAGPYTHPFTVLNDNAHQTYSVVRIDDQGRQRTFTYSMLESITFSYDAAGTDPLMAEMTWKSKPEATQSDVTPAYETTEVFIYPDMCTLELQDDGTGFSAANVDVKSFSLTITKNLEEIIKGGTPDVQGWKNTNFDVTGSLTVDKINDTDFDEAFTNQDKEMQLVLTSGTNVLTFTLGSLTFDQPTLGSDNDGIETMERTFQLNEAQSELTASLVNDVTAYPRT